MVSCMGGRRWSAWAARRSEAFVRAIDCCVARPHPTPGLVAGEVHRAHGCGHSATAASQAPEESRPVRTRTAVAGSDHAFARGKQRRATYCGPTEAARTAAAVRYQSVAQQKTAAVAGCTQCCTRAVEAGMLADAVCSNHQQRWCTGSTASCARGESGHEVASTIDACAPAATTNGAGAAPNAAITTVTAAPAAAA